MRKSPEADLQSVTDRPPSHGDNFRLVPSEELPEHVWIQVEDNIRQYQSKDVPPNLPPSPRRFHVYREGRWDDEEKGILLAYWNTRPTRQIAELLNRKPAAVAVYANRMFGMKRG